MAMKLMQPRRMYIDNLAAEMGVDPVTGEGTGDGGMSRIDMNEAGVAANTAAITAETTAREKADTALGERIDTETETRIDDGHDAP